MKYSSSDYTNIVINSTYCTDMEREKAREKGTLGTSHEMEDKGTMTHLCSLGGNKHNV